MLSFLGLNRWKYSILCLKKARISIVDFSADGSYPITVRGMLTIHGESQEVETEGTIIIQDGKISAKATFDVAVADYNIKIPAVVKDNIAKIITIVVSVDYELFKKKS